MYANGSRYWALPFIIANVFQTCLTYDIEVIFSNRFYNCIIKLKCILVIFCVTMNSEIMYKKLFVVKEVG